MSTHTETDTDLTESAQKETWLSNINVPVFSLSAVIVILVAGIAIAFPDTISAFFSAGVDWIGRWFGSFYIFLLTIILIFVIVLALSRYGKVKLGPDNSTPDFSTFSWAAMLFAAGVGTGIMFYAVAEPVAQYLAPPTGDGETAEAARNAITMSLFHYGISGWGLYSLVGMSMAYFAYRHGRALSVRSTLRPLLGDRVDGWIGDLVDTAALVGGVFGIAATLGVGVIQLNVGLEIVFGIPQGTAAQIGLLSLSVMMATVSAVSGVDRGVRILSSINVFLAVGLAIWVLITGNTAFLFDALVANLGDFATQFPHLTLETYAYDRPTEWLNGWTLFFWAWWITWAAFVGMFLARISRGRTIREFVIGSLVLPFSYVVMWMGIFGNTALDLIRSGDTEFAEAAAAAPEQGLYMLLERMPGSMVLIAVAVFVGILFYVTSADSGALVMANLSVKNQVEGKDAPAWLRIFWATVIGVLTIAMLLAGGFSILQQAIIVMALPFSFVVLAAMVGFWRTLHDEVSRTTAQETAIRNRFLGHTGTAGGLQETSWRDRLTHSFDIVSPARAKRALDKRVVPAMEAVANELRERGLTAEVYVQGKEVQDADDVRNFLGRATLLVLNPDDEQLVDTDIETLREHPSLHTNEVFRYVVRMVEAPVPSYGAFLREADDVTVRLEVRPKSGGQGYDIMDWNADQIAHDVLDHYEGWFDYLSATETV